MIDNIKEGWNVAIFAFILILATLGGVLGNLVRTTEKGQHPKFWFVVLEGAASAFVGALVTLIFYATGTPWEWAGVTAGLGGWMGARVTMRRLDKFLERKFGVENDG